MRIRTLHAAAAAALVLALVGCVDSDPLPTLPPTPTATPIFASEEEALAAAEAAYAAYQDVVDDALQTLDATGLEEVAVGTALESARASVERLSAQGKHQVGSTVVTSSLATDLSALTEFGSDSPIQIYACVDVSNVQIVATDGSVTQSTIGTFPMLVTFRVDDSRLLVEEELVWDANTFC